MLSSFFPEVINLNHVVMGAEVLLLLRNLVKVATNTDFNLLERQIGERKYVGWKENKG